MSRNGNKPNQKPKETSEAKVDQPNEGDKKTEGSGSKPEYKSNNPGDSGWKDKKKS